MRESIEKFAEAMEKKLQQHDQDRGKLGWIVDPSCTLEYLLGRLKDEIIEYEESEDHSEMIDIANFAMMIWDREEFGRTVIDPLSR